MTDIANDPEGPLAVAWSVIRLGAGKSPDRITSNRLQHQMQTGWFPDGEGLPLWLGDVGLQSTVLLSELDSDVPAPDTTLATRINWLDDQSQVEVLLALLGLKVSRLTLALRDAVRLQHILAMPLVCGTDLVEVRVDSALPSFSNLAVRSPIAAHAIKSVAPDQTIDIYVAVDWRSAAICWALDRHDKVGELLGIPECCRRWFAANWETCVAELDGDLAYCCLRNELGFAKANIPAAANPYAVYLGGSLLGHFPCSPRCQATTAVAAERQLALSGVAPELLKRVSERHRQPIWVSPSRAISTTEPDGAGGKWCRVTPVG